MSGLKDVLNSVGKVAASFVPTPLIKAVEKVRDKFEGNNADVARQAGAPFRAYFDSNQGAEIGMLDDLELEDTGIKIGEEVESDGLNPSSSSKAKCVAKVALVAAAILAVVAILAVSTFLSIGISLGLAALGATSAVGFIAIVATKVPLVLGCGLAILAVMAGAAKGLDVIDCPPAFESKV